METAFNENEFLKKVWLALAPVYDLTDLTPINNGASNAEVATDTRVGDADVNDVECNSDVERERAQASNGNGAVTIDKETSPSIRQEGVPSTFSFECYSPKNEKRLHPTSIVNKIKNPNPKLPRKWSSNSKRYRARRSTHIEIMKAAIIHYRSRLELPPKYDCTPKCHPLKGKMRPVYLPPPELQHNMTYEQLSEWKRMDMMQRKKLGMRKIRAKKGKELKEMKDELYKLVCMTEGSVFLSESEVINRFKCPAYLKTLIDNDAAEIGGKARANADSDPKEPSQFASQGVPQSVSHVAEKLEVVRGLTCLKTETS